MFHLKVKNVSPKSVSNKTLSIKFFLKPLKKKQNRYVVHAQIRFNRTKAEFTTGIRCLIEEWDELKEEFVNNSIFNQQLLDFKSNIFRIKNKLDESNISFTASDIKRTMFGDQKSDEILLVYFNAFIDRKVKNNAWSESTLRLYYNTYSYLNEFLSTYNIKSITLGQFDKTILSNFDDYLKQVIWNEAGDRLSISSINKHHARVKAVLNEAISRGDLFRSSYSTFTLRFPASSREYLTIQELKKIIKLDLSDNSALDEVRDIFLFSCYTGLRFSDAIGLTMNNIMNINEEKHIRIDQLKTNERREIPLLKNAYLIINKYESASFRINECKILPKYSNQRVNIHLKIIGAMAGVNKNLTHHIARHTCATTILLDNNVPIDLVSHWLGHNNIRTTQIYAKISHTKLQNQSQRLNQIINI